MSFTRRPGSRRPQQTSRQEDLHIIRNSRVQPTASSAAIQAQVAPSLWAPVSSRTIRRRLIEDLDAHPSTSSFGVVPRATKLDCSGIEPGRL
ncbi:HTH_Tnp_Tc3_2 domain-containing protein [Trichonephila clavipes]|uniref:HTH_Tnp_Tc3_2 domain-containing protein n=1 Tax=Trichonephila clavipes TaxID=2585209 RepID=A0A8X6SDM9_TRICX|nr:HTH_Tnp_Tc3_2 domain-containing protein [Trichonephila clavipes]